MGARSSFLSCRDSVSNHAPLNPTNLVGLHRFKKENCNLIIVGGKHKQEATLKRGKIQKQQYVHLKFAVLAFSNSAKCIPPHTAIHR